MKIVTQARELRPAGRAVCLALGVFDGVHLGHQRVIARMLEEAQQCGGLAVVVTFDRHPNAVIAPERVPPMIYSLPQKLRTLATLGVEATWLIAFDAAFRQQSGKAFVQRLLREFGALHSVSVGAGFVFGHQRSGNVELLRSLGGQHGFAVQAQEPVTLDGAPVSSTRIREAIRAGDLAQAGRMLGRPWALAGLVTRGDGLGRKLGFPTANLEVAGLVLPPAGVYTAWAAGLGQEWPAVVNVGVRPTLNPAQPRLRVEAHLLGFEGELYGRELELRWGRRLRAERKFANLAELQEQIARDIAEARKQLTRESAEG